MLKKAVMFLLAMFLMAGMTVGFAAGKANAGAGKAVRMVRSRYSPEEEKAILAAKAEIPATAEFQGIITEQETDRTTDILFFDNSTLRSYEVTVLKDAGQVKTVKIGGSNIPGSTTVNKTVKDIEEALKLEYPDGRILSIEQKQEGNLRYYEAQLETQRFTADLQVNPVTGAIGKQVLEYKAEAPKPEIKQLPPATEKVKPEKHEPIPPVPSEWTCGNCGTLNREGQFCANCGIQRPADMQKPVAQCSKCGWKPQDPGNLPNFCPECGNRFEKQ